MAAAPGATVLAVSPHPDDELLGAPATLMALRDAGWRVVNLACGLGRAEDRERRRAELVLACRTAGFELVIGDRLPPIGRGDDLRLAQGTLSEKIAAEAGKWDARLIVAPSPHDAHHGHEVVGRAARDAVEARAQPVDVMFWALWGDLPLPNVLVSFDASRLNEIRLALRAHAGELARNRFDLLLKGRAMANAVLGPERVFGFGVAGGQGEYAELLTQVRWGPGRGWRLTAPHAFDQSDPSAGAERTDIGWWLHTPSVRATAFGDGNDR